MCSSVGGQKKGVLRTCSTVITNGTLAIHIRLEGNMYFAPPEVYYGLHTSFLN